MTIKDNKCKPHANEIKTLFIKHLIAYFKNNNTYTHQQHFEELSRQCAGFNEMIFKTKAYCESFWHIRLAANCSKQQMLVIHTAIKASILAVTEHFNLLHPDRASDLQSIQMLCRESLQGVSLELAAPNHFGLSAASYRALNKLKAVINSPSQSSNQLTPLSPRSGLSSRQSNISTQENPMSNLSQTIAEQQQQPKPTSAGMFQSMPTDAENSTVWAYSSHSPGFISGFFAALKKCFAKVGNLLARMFTCFTPTPILAENANASTTASNHRTPSPERTSTAFSQQKLALASSSILSQASTHGNNEKSDFYDTNSNATQNLISSSLITNLFSKPAPQLTSLREPLLQPGERAISSSTFNLPG